MVNFYLTGPKVLTDHCVCIVVDVPDELLQEPEAANAALHAAIGALGTGITASLHPIHTDLFRLIDEHGRDLVRQAKLPPKSTHFAYK